MSFVTRALKVSVILLWVFSGTIGLLAARNFERKLDAAVAELSVVRKDAERKLEAATAELAAVRKDAETAMAALEQQQAAALDSAARWRGKFEHLCSVVEQAASDAASGTLSVLK